MMFMRLCPRQIVHTASLPGYFLFACMVAMPVFTLWGVLLQTSRVSQLPAFGVVSPITGGIFSEIFLSESGKISAVQCVISLLLVSLGIYIVNSGQEDTMSIYGAGVLSL